MLYPMCHNSCYQVLPGGHYAGGLGLNKGLDVWLYKRWIKRQSSFESTPVIQTKGLIKNIKKQYWYLTLSILNHYIDLSVAFMCINYIGPTERAQAGRCRQRNAETTSTPVRWHMLVHSHDNSISKWSFLNTWHTKSYYSVFPCIYHVCCHNLTFCFNAIDSSEMMHIL